MLFKTLRNNKGSAMVIYVCMFVAMLGFAAVAVDTGRVIVQKQKLQDAVDASALAAAMKLPNTCDALAAANRYITLNGFSPSDITVTFADSNKTVVVSARKAINYTFGKVLGLNGTTISPGAKAQCGTIGGAFNYSLFSGSPNTSLTLNGSGYSIIGSTHTNYNFMANGSSITITGACEAMGTITVNGSDIHINNRVQHAASVSMPDFSETIYLEAQAAGQVYNGDMTFNGSSIDVTHPLYVNGNITINGSKFKGVGCIFATGSITFNGSSMKMSSSDAVCIYSKTGNIKVNGSSAEVDGILYAPGGNITMNGSSQVVHGRVIGNSVTLNGSSIQIIGGTTELNSIPSSYVKLVK
jgi:Flp pilus assembly protein TadG/phage baseplate assembly protein gpV